MNISKIDALCRKNNISRTILEWEKSPYGPSITTLKKVADYFGEPIDYLLADN